MDAQQLGAFIARRRKELGMTQNQLAQKLHVTDKAISRWERGIGFPDINSLEALAHALQVSLTELMQAKLNGNQSISTSEAEQLLLNTIEISRTTGRAAKVIGGIVLSVFALVVVLVLLLLITSGGIVAFSVGSIVLGLVAWGMPVWQICFAKMKRNDVPAIASFASALASVAIQFGSIAYDIRTNDWAAVEDTVEALLGVVIIFSVITIMLNAVMMLLSNSRR